MTLRNDDDRSIDHGQLTGLHGRPIPPLPTLKPKEPEPPIDWGMLTPALFRDFLKLWRFAALTFGVIVAIILLYNHFKPLTEHSTCNQFESASASAQDKVIQQMNATHSDANDSATSLSVALFCRLYPNRPIDGVYDGSL